jgi:hypothetical protein
MMIDTPVGYRRVRNRVMETFGAKPDECPAFERYDNLRVICTTQTEQDGKRWLHVSVSKKGGKLPSYRELCEVKASFIGKDAIAYQVFPPSSEHVNIHKACLHLWAPLDHRPTPDFTWGSGSI